MLKLKIYFVIVLSLTSLVFSAQKKKEIKKYGIKTVSSTQTQGSRTIKNSQLTYNSNGQLAVEILYDEEGRLLSTTKYKYNSEENVVEETEHDEKNVLKEKRTMKYNALSQKTEELVADKDGRQIKKFTYTYDSKGLRTEKKTFDANNTLMISKRVVYTFK